MSTSVHMADNNKSRRALLQAATGTSLVALAGCAGLVSTNTAGLGREEITEPTDRSKGRDENITFLPATEISRRIRNGELSSQQVVEACLDRIAEREDEINAFITLTQDEAREAAREADRAVKKDEDLGPLHGVPFAVKDGQAVEGIRYTSGIFAFDDRIAEETDPFVQAFIDAGAIVIGKTNLPEFGHYGESQNLLNGPTSNPFDIYRTAGGSSGGSAAAVADGFVPFATGSDAAGSIRIPAAFTGTYGLYPGAKSPGNFEPEGQGLYGTYSQYGVQTRNVRDTVELLSIARADDEIEYRDALDRSIDGFDIGFDFTPANWIVDDRAREVIDQNISSFEGAGADLEEISMDLGADSKEIIDTFITIWSGGVASLAGRLQAEHGLDVLGEDSHLFTEHFEERVKQGRQFINSDGSLKAEHLERTIETREKIWNGFLNLFEEYDLLVMPTVPVIPFENKEFGGPSEVNGQEIDPTFEWASTAICNLTGLPAASVPAGLTNGGLPVGMMIIGPPRETESVIAASAAYEDENPWHHHYPGLQ